MTVGLISDTHGFWDDQISALFAGVDHILHAGDIGDPSILASLERIAPVTAVMGNCDGLPLDARETEVIDLGGIAFWFIILSILMLRTTDWPGASITIIPPSWCLDTPTSRMIPGWIPSVTSIRAMPGGSASTNPAVWPSSIWAIQPCRCA